MIKNLFTESQIRQIIEKVNHVAQSNNGIIHITKIEDAASLAAYIAGYSSWKQYRKANKKDSKLLELNFSLENLENKNFNSLTVDISPHIILEFESYLKSLQNKSIPFELKENKQLLFKIAVGQNYNKLTKSNQTYFLNLENTCFIGNNSRFIDYVKANLKEQLQTVIEINSGNKSSEKLDPINEIFTSDYLEDFLTNGTQNNKNFIFIWGLLIKQLAKQFKLKFTADFLMKSLELDFILKAWCLLSKENNYLSKILIDYIKSLSLVKVDKSKINISKDSQEKHWENVKKIYFQLLIIKNAYDDGIFLYNGLKLIDCMISKKSIDIVIPNKTNGFIFNIIEFVLTSASAAYQKLVKGLDIKEHAIFIINKHENIRKLPIKNDYVFCLAKLLPYESKMLDKFEQIVFSKHLSFIEPSLEFIRNFYLNTTKIEDNIFTNSGKILLELDENSAYLWKKENKDSEISFFVLQKIYQL